MSILQVGPLKPSLAETLHVEHGALVLPDEHRDAFVAEHAGTVEVIVTSAWGRVGAGLIAALPALAAIVNFGVGHENIDVDAARERGIAVSNTPEVLDDCVADCAVGLVIDVMRGFSAADRYVRAGRWPDRPYRLTRRVTGARVGILGLGRIGRAVATRLGAFRCEIEYHNRNELDDVPYAYRRSPRELAAAVDVLLVCAAGGSGTTHLVDCAVLDALGPDGYLVNVARGSVVDQDALVRALGERRIAGAGLDVFSDEPRVPAELLDLENVVLLPHVASGTVETRGAMEALVLDNLRSFLRDGSLVTPV